MAILGVTRGPSARSKGPLRTSFAFFVQLVDNSGNCFQYRRSLARSTPAKRKGIEIPRIRETAFGANLWIVRNPCLCRPNLSIMGDHHDSAKIHRHVVIDTITVRGDAGPPVLPTRRKP